MEYNDNSCINKTFDNLIKRNNDLKEVEIARFLPIIGFIIEILIEIIGIFIVYYAMKKLAILIVGKNFNSNFLYSMVFIPLVSVLKQLPNTMKSVFVRIAVSDEYIICKRGFFRKYIDELYIKHIDNIEFRTTIWGEWFNYGNIKLYSFGGNINMPFLKNPHKVYKILKSKMVKRSGF